MEVGFTQDFWRSLLDNLHDGVYFVDRDRRISYWNEAAERITGYHSAEVMGRRCSEGLLNHVDDQGNQLCLSGCPLAATLNDGLPRSAQMYLHHKNGHRVPVSISAACVLDQGGTVVGAVETFRDDSAHLAALERIRELEQAAYLDPLTGIASRRFARIAVESRLNELRRYGWSFGVVFADVDHFKRVNDAYGHEVGDRVLAMVAKTLSTNLRSFDVVARWGGEEFLAIVANVNEDQMRTMANRLRTLVEKAGLPLGPTTIGVTISAGATIAQATDSLDTLVERADQLMYFSKVLGRNRVSMTLDIDTHRIHASR